MTALVAHFSNVTRHEKAEFILQKKVFLDSEECSIVATQPRQLHYSNNLSKTKKTKKKINLWGVTDQICLPQKSYFCPSAPKNRTNKNNTFFFFF